MKKSGDIFTEERHRQILELINDKKRVTVQELCDQFRVSTVTIRSDLNALKKHGKLIRTHGGALAIDGPSLIAPFDIRRHANEDIKKAIGRAAADLVSDGEVIFIDGGTTALAQPQHLTNKKDLTVITPSIDVAYWLMINTAFNVYMLNGFINRKSHSTIGEPYEAFMSEWNIASAFCGAAGFTLQEGLTDNHIGFVEQKKIIAKKARSVIGLIDSSKIGKVSLGTFAQAEEVDIIITDSGIRKEMKLAIENAGIQVMLV